MEKTVELKIKTIRGTIIIPFIDLESVDLFTVRYANRYELITGLSSILNLSLVPQDVEKVYLYCEYVSRKNLFKTKNDYIKYRGDNFNIKFLEDSFSLYLKQEHDRIRTCGVMDINSKAMYDFKCGEDKLTDFDIEDAVRKYLTNAPYRTFRKVYFMIKGHVRVSINRVIREDDKNIRRNLSEFHTDDEYLQYLLEYASRGEEECSRVMEELSQYDLEELSSRLKHSHYGLFDGVGNNQNYTLEDLYDLEKYTGLSIEELTAYVSSRHRRGRS